MPAIIAKNPQHTASNPVTKIHKVNPQPRNVAVLLPLTGKLSASGQAIRNGFLTAHYYAKQKNQAVEKIKFFDTNHHNVSALYSQAISQGADFVVGPLTKNEVAAVAKIRPLTIPVLALNTIDVYQKSFQTGLFQFGLSPQDEAIQAAHKIWQDGCKRVLIIAPKNNWSKNLVDTFQYNYANLGGQTLETLAYTNKKDLAQQIGELLKVNPAAFQPIQTRGETPVRIDPLSYRRQDFDAFFLIARPDDARLIRPLLKFHLVGDVPVYATSLIYNGNPSPALDADLNGINFCDLPWVLRDSSSLPTYIRMAKQQITSVWPNSSHQSSKLYALGIDAYNSMRFLNKGGVFPSNGLAGATGELHLDNRHHLYRDLDWAKFRHGKPVSNH